jgi:hypothetical protein
MKTKTKKRYNKNKNKKINKKRRKSQYGRGSAKTGEEEEINKIKRLLQSRFQPLAAKLSLFSHIVYEDNYPVSKLQPPVYKMFICQSQDSLQCNTNECFTITIQEYSMRIDSLKYPDMQSCTISGPDILFQLYHFARDMHLDTISLEDASSLNIGNCSLLLSSFYRLLYGYSWYNKYGYYSIHTIKEKNEVNVRRNMSLKAFYEDFEDKTEYGAVMSNIAGLITIMKNDEITMDMSIGDFMVILNAKIKTHPNNLRQIIEYYDAIEFAVDLHYDSFLTLYVNDEDTKKIYGITKRRSERIESYTKKKRESL